MPARLIHEVRRLADHPAPTPQPTPCRLWQGALSHGYARRRDGGLMSRWVMQQAGHDIVGLDVLHRCDQPLCYRYEHLFTGTQADNMRDAIAKGRIDPRALAITQDQPRDSKTGRFTPAVSTPRQERN